MSADETKPSNWFKKLRIPAPAAPWAIKLNEMTLYERSFHFSRMLIHGLQAIRRAGISPRYKGMVRSDFVSEVVIHVSMNDFLELERTRLHFNCSMAVVFASLYEQTDTAARANLETEYMRRGLPGDPSALSDRVINTWLQDNVPVNIRDALADLTAQTSHLQKRLDAHTWMHSILMSTLLYCASEDTIERFAGMLDIPSERATLDEIFKRLAKYFA